MQLVSGITNESKQHFKFPITNNQEVDVYLTWKDTQNSWFVDIVYGEVLSIYGMKIVMTPNLLSQFANKIPFGISIVSNTSQDPMTIDSFSSGDWVFIFLDATDVANYEAKYG